MLELNLYTPNKIQKLLSQRIKRLRLINEWTQVELAERSGISLASLKRFESTGKISLERLLLLAWTFGRLDEFTSLLEEPEIMTLADIRKLEKKRQRGKRRSSKKVRFHDYKTVGHLINYKKQMFEYSPEFIKTGLALSPFHLPNKSGVFIEKERIFSGLYGLFNDSLPDGWGFSTIRYQNYYTIRTFILYEYTYNGSINLSY